MTAERDPERWLSADDDVAKQLRPLLRMARGEGPSVSEHARMWNSLVAQLPAAADGGGPAAADASTLAGRPASWWIAGTGVVAAVFGFLAALVVTRSASAPRAPDVSPVAAAALSQTQPALQPTASSGPAVIEGASTTESAPGREAMQPSVPLARPSHARGRSRVPPGSDSPASHGAAAPPAAIVKPQPGAATPDAPAADVASELDLLARARRIVASEPERALQLTAEHARRFPQGVLAQEREVLAIDALFHAGHRDLAVAGARRFIERHPNSAHRVRLAAELEAP